MKLSGEDLYKIVRQIKLATRQLLGADKCRSLYRIVKAKFHYISCFGACSELVQSWFEAGSN